MGCGKVADYGHLPAIQGTPGITLHALYDPNAGQLAAARNKFGVRHAYTDIRKFFECGVDAVCITSPAPCHLENVITAAQYHKHILCEKPLAMTVAECERMIQVTQAAGVMLFTAFDYRFSPVAGHIRSLIQQGTIGKVRSLRLIYIWHCHGKYETAGNGPGPVNRRRELRMLEGGPLVDCGVHQIDLARFWLQSEAVRWTGSGAWVDEYEAPDHVYLHMDHACGAHTMVEMSFSYCHTCLEPVNQFVYEIIGSQGIIRYDRNARLFELRNSHGTETLPFSPEKNFAGMYVAFAEALAAGRSDVLPTGYDGLMAARISREVTDTIIANRIQSLEEGS